MTYVRPDLGSRVHVAPDGEVVVYGQQHQHRRGEGPPQEFYSVDLHPERFAALHDVADALVAELCRVYDVQVDPAPPLSDETIVDADHQREARLVPSDPAAAPLTIVWTGYPGIVVRAGGLYGASYPICGCRACDESCEAAAASLEACIEAWVRGRVEETVVHRDDDWWVGSRVLDADGERSSEGSARVAGDRLPAVLRAAALLAAMPGGWAPWPEVQPS